MLRYALPMILAVALFVPAADAEVTWTDIGGDIYLLYFYGENILDMSDDDATIFGNDSGDMLRTEIHLNFKADFDDVTVGVSVEADRDLESFNDNGNLNAFDDAFVATDLGVFLEEAYITVVDVFDTSASLTAGRFFANRGDDSTAEDFNGYWGDGFFIGDGDPGTPTTVAALGDWETDPFDGLWLTADFEEVVLDLTYLIATDNNGADASDDTSLLGLYLSYVPSSMENLQLDAYMNWVDSEGPDANAFLFNNSDLYSFGLRVAGACMDDEIAWKLEGVYQTGDSDDVAAAGGDDMDVDAWAVEAGINYHPDLDYAPEVGFVYTYLSGDDDPMDDDMESFTAPFENKGYGMIADAFVFTNSHVFHLDAGCDLTEDLSLDTDWFYFLLAEEDAGIASLGGDAFVVPVGVVDDDELGWEVDVQLDYEYSENIDAFLGAAVFFPGDAVEDALGDDDEALFIRTGVKVAF